MEMKKTSKSHYILPRPHYLSYAVQFDLIGLDSLCANNGLFVLFRVC